MVRFILWVLLAAACLPSVRDVSSNRVRDTGLEPRRIFVISSMRRELRPDTGGEFFKELEARSRACGAETAIHEPNPLNLDEQIASKKLTAFAADAALFVESTGGVVNQYDAVLERNYKFTLVDARDAKTLWTAEAK